MVQRLLDSLSSLRVAMVLLCAAAGLVFIGTIAQVDMGLYAAQTAFFRSFLVYWGPKGANWTIPILPGGYLIGTLLVINLVAAQIKHFEWTKSRLGLQMTHLGVILLLIGQLATDMLSIESHIRLRVGQPLNYSEASQSAELFLAETSAAEHARVFAFPEETLARKGSLTHPDLPFQVRVLSYSRNSQVVGRSIENRGTTNGLAAFLQFDPLPKTTKMDARDIPAALVQIQAGNQVLGEWWVSNWTEEESLAQMIYNDSTPQLRAALERGQTFQQAGKTWRLGMRPTRFYVPFSLELMKFTHEKYSGTEIPKNFSSRVHLRNAATGEDREALIYMNNPLRYAGLTYYQFSFDQADPNVTVLQVVRNPGWLTPYVGCVLVGVGLTCHFLISMVQFLNQRRQRSLAPSSATKTV